MQQKIGGRQLDPQEKSALIDLAWRLLFVGHKELHCLYRSVYDSSVTQWLIDQANLNIRDPDFDTQFATKRYETWFTCLAGADIASFCRVNRIVGQSIRPDLRALVKLGAIDQTLNFTQETHPTRPDGYKRVFIFEDIVGSGEQFEETWPILEAFANRAMPVLFAPLFIAPTGDEFVRDKIAKSNDADAFTYSPLFVLPADLLLTENSSRLDAESVRILRKVFVRLSQTPNPYGHRGTGMLTLTSLNCPDNVPLIIHRGPTALFPRASREGG